MLKKNNLLNTWLWKWHVIAGLITLPFMLLLAITGTIYLFKDNVNHQLYSDKYFAHEATQSTQSLPLSQQLAAAQVASNKPIAGVTLPTEANQNTVFTVKGKGRASNELFVDPYTGETKGTLNQRETLMFDVRKLHGELLLNTPGTLVIELVASWFLVLIITGLYVWWPKSGSGAAGFFTIRFNQGKQKLWRDLHAVVSFWLSVFLLIILAGGMPWTDVFGDQLKWVQSKTDTGYPAHWRGHKNIDSVAPNKLNTPRLNLDNVANIAKTDLKLEGKITILLPKHSNDTYKVSNRSLFLNDQKVVYLDQYTGQTIKALTWDDVGILMDIRQVFMRLHQGEYGLANWIVLLVVALFFTLSTIAGLVSYYKRKPEGSWGIPRVPSRFKVDNMLVSLILCLGVIFPMFGISLIVIFIGGFLNKHRNIKALQKLN